MATFPNGQIPLNELVKVPAHGGRTALLLPGPAESFFRVREKCKRAGLPQPEITGPWDGYRSDFVQIRTFLGRYQRQWAQVRQNGRWIVDRRKWNGVYYYRFTGAAAAVPLTSNHGEGATFDRANSPAFGTDLYNRLEDILADEQWSDDEGRSVWESWHKNWLGDPTIPVVNTHLIPAVNITPVVTDAPDPLEQLRKGTPMEIRIRRSDGEIALVDTQVGKFIRLDPSMNEVLATLGVPLPAVWDGVLPVQYAQARQAVVDVCPDPVRVDPL